MSTSARDDGRLFRELRPLFVGKGCLTNCAASSVVEIGNSRVVCCLRGPQQLQMEARGHRGKISCSVLNASAPSVKHQDIDIVLEGLCEQVVCLETIPQLHFEAIFSVLSSEGSHYQDLPALTAAITTCLMHAGVSMRDIPCAGSAALLGGGVICVDPTPEEFGKALATTTVIVCTETAEVCFAHHKGTVDISSSIDLLEAAISASCFRRTEVISPIQQ